MASVQKTVLIEYSAEQMFALVDEVEKYPQFLPWCARTELLERDRTQTAATLHINFHGVKTHFSTRNDKEVPKWMKIHLVDGPFRALEGSWTFKPLGETACKIEFVLNYEFSNRLLEKVIGPVFNKIAKTFVDAFVKRAKQIYS